VPSPCKKDPLPVSWVAFPHVFQLYNFSPTPHYGGDSVEDATLVPAGTHLALVHPYLRFPMDDPAAGPPCLRCDNPQAARILETPSQVARAREGNLDHEVSFLFWKKNPK
jgi:hypothetical protein